MRLTPKRWSAGRGGAARVAPEETVVGDSLAAAGLRDLERQYRIELPGHEPARFDLAVPTARLAIEIDIFPTHRETEGRRRDDRRDDVAASIDWSVERLVEGDLGQRLPATVRRLVAIARSRQR